ncbi:helix-turn-helix transcriptional regulator [Mesorhizobium xinjiangense]|uniref:helix-turn-helix transcriptional regulator n=1 Tax=Mesorhizobium xinjiangense TaxID=2678685 RepID=UPI002E27389A
MGSFRGVAGGTHGGDATVNAEALREAIAAAKRAVALASEAIQDAQNRANAMQDGACGAVSAVPAGVPRRGNRAGLLTPADAADAMNISIPTLARWRSEGAGPAYVKLGGRVLYKVGDIEDFIEGSIRTKTRGERSR